MQASEASPPQGDALQLGELRTEARRLMELCNACRYCEGFCAVFPAMERRRSFADGELDYLANLCHGCRGCYYACPYTPPHEFQMNVPRTLAELRLANYAAYTWPAGMARLFARNGVVVSLLTALCLTLVIVLTAAMRAPEVLFGTHRGPGAFYAIIPMEVMVVAAGVPFGYAILAIVLSVARYWRSTGNGAPLSGGAVLGALGDVLTLRNLGGAGHGCNDRDESFSRARRTLHHSLFYGFALCFAATTVAAFYEHFLHWTAPYSYLSLPVVLGTVGGIGMVVGTAGLGWLRLTGDPTPASPRLGGSDAALLWLLGLTALTGLVLLVLRETWLMGLLLAVHLGVVLALFVAMPYSRFVHGFYRAAALLRNAAERRAESGSGPSHP